MARRAAKTSTALVRRAPAGKLAPTAGMLTDAEARASIMSRWLRGKKPDTVRTYGESIHAFAIWWRRRVDPTMGGDEAAVRALLALARPQGNALVAQWFDDQLEDGRAVSTIRVRYAALRSLSELLVEQLGEGEYVPRARPPKADRRTPLEARSKLQRVRPAYLAVMEHLLQRLPDGDWRVVRDLAIIRAGSTMGLRRKEIVGLNLGHVDVASRVLWIWGKGRRKREPVVLPQGYLDLLAMWLAVRGAGDASDPLFFATGGERLERAAINRIVARRASEAGVMLRPHDLRRLFCTKVIERFGLRRGKSLTRHTSEATLSIYDLSEGEQLEQMADEAAED